MLPVPLRRLKRRGCSNIAPEVSPSTGALGLVVLTSFAKLRAAARFFSLRLDPVSHVPQMAGEGVCAVPWWGAAEGGFRLLEFRTRLTLFFSQLQGSAISLSPRLFFFWVRSTPAWDDAL